MIYFRLYDEARRAMRNHKWLESEKVGRDLGVEVEKEWIQTYWRRFYRFQFAQHIRGLVFFEEFGEEYYGLVLGRLADLPTLVENILELVQEGAENLDLIRWAMGEGHCLDQVLTVLAAMDINRHRLPPPQK